MPSCSYFCERLSRCTEYDVPLLPSRQAARPHARCAASAPSKHTSTERGGTIYFTESVIPQRYIGGNCAFLSGLAGAPQMSRTEADLEARKQRLSEPAGYRKGIASVSAAYRRCPIAGARDGFAPAQHFGDRPRFPILDRKI